MGPLEISFQMNEPIGATFSPAQPLVYNHTLLCVSDSKFGLWAGVYKKQGRKGEKLVIYKRPIGLHCIFQGL